MLARFLQNQRAGSPDLTWWEHPRAVQRHIRRLVFGLVVGLTAALAAGIGTGVEIGLDVGLEFGIDVGLSFGLTVGAAFALVVGRSDAATPAIRLRLAWSNLTLGLVTGLAVWLVVGPTGGLVVVAFGLQADNPDLRTSAGLDMLIALDPPHLPHAGVCIRPRGRDHGAGSRARPWPGSRSGSPRQLGETSSSSAPTSRCAMASHGHEAGTPTFGIIGFGTPEEAVAALTVCVKEVVSRENALRLRTAPAYADAATAVREQPMEVVESARPWYVAREDGARNAALLRQELDARMGAY
ncbi:hypothetical protein ACQEV9_44305 [Streptomyces chartreusis]|uniref:hypothetical protein n=1 Tax=Streptomyces chartreusis TaxID=1969 RepID=UPI003D8DF7BF